MRTHEAAAAGTIGDLERVRDTLRAQVALMEGSHSWKLTAPLRASRRLAGRSAALGRKVLSDGARSVYRGLPLTSGAKRALKEAVFRTAPWLVRHTAAYRAWQLQSAGGAPTSLPLQDAAATISAGAEPEVTRSRRSVATVR